MLETICDVMLDAYKRNWITSRDGNVSIRHHDRDHFYITPSGVRKQTLQPDQFKRFVLLAVCCGKSNHTLISVPISNRQVNYPYTLDYSEKWANTAMKCE
jgi:L-fuculose-phosphate aldolase